MTRTTTGLDAQTAELLTGSLRKMLADNPDGSGLGDTLAELGWDEVLADDRPGATTLLFVEHGRALATSRVLDEVLLAELAPSLPAPGTGPRAPFYPLGTAAPVAPDAPLAGLLLGGLDGVAEVVVPVALDGQVGLSLVPADLVAAATRPAGGFDPASRWLLVDGPVAELTRYAGSEDGSRVWDRAVAVGRLAVAAEIIGVCAAALAIAVEHTSARVQYGRQIATFQAVRHRLSEAHVAIESARSVLAAAWKALEHPDGGSGAARLAKLRAGWAQAEVMRHALQVCGAMGLSLEHPLHRHVSRAAALDALLGGHRALTGQLGAELLTGAELDPIVEI
ncbi:MAG: acyl-CoA dehydrogenase [Frankia sp.]|nr:acyl-CoA dehydrogenase [Frankia sp.]